MVAQRNASLKDTALAVAVGTESGDWCIAMAMQLKDLISFGRARVEMCSKMEAGLTSSAIGHKAAVYKSEFLITGQAVKHKTVADRAVG